MLQACVQRAAVVVVVGVCVSVCGCSARTSEFERDIRALENKLADLRSFQAEQSSEITSLSERVRHLTGKVIRRATNTRAFTIRI